MTCKTTLAAALGLVLMSGAALASHANPWATADDTVLEKYHDANQAKSIGTPGEDEMRGAMTRKARGKLEDPQGGTGGGGGNGDRKGRR
ncbi:hypothetical protein [Mameliella sediminis]|uniref:hypothetical protein n=1 Tax=Mameliella sediminis TaxID=2836866 RepID=UPI001C460394|nr:hypothetical protein [Mameliella sediminis]MBV7392579.1 hypothetical protein [Mameliella sediminis]MBY6114940.1 hypothetical protein [Antarctobacter heliothermus]MBY6144513.1 hypothetical protein [Mameliella alba]MCA0954562.1 hypothetical protein [Mameliella alba]